MNGIDRMLAAYVACALWASTGDEGEPLDGEHEPDDIAPETLATMRADCVSFWDANHETIGVRFEEAGHDLWLTRNRHGCGFWDGDWPAADGKTLTDAAQAMGEVDLYVGDDGRIYS